ncbi:MAG: phosphoribosyltransferase [Bryobacteraceae bacterium]
MQPWFKDRADAGRQLAERLALYRNHPKGLVLGLPRGGLPVAFEVATALNLSLDVFLVRKLGVPGHEELAMGAIASGGIRVVNEDVVRHLRISREVIDAVAAREQEELRRRERLYRGDHPPPTIAGRTVILVDDGLATGSTMRAAVAALREQTPAKVVVAVPVAASEICRQMAALVDDMVCLHTPEPFYAVGLWYERFPQISDAEVGDLLERAGAGVS